MGFLDLLKSLVGGGNWDYSERRGRLRVRCRIEASLISKSGLMGIEIKDISVKGMQALCLAKVSKGAQVQIQGVKQYNQAEVKELNCLVEWVKKQPGGWSAGLSFLDSAKDMGRSWLFWELKSQNVKMRGHNQKREEHRVQCLIPARLTSSSQNLQAKVVNLSPNGALVQTTGNMMKPGEILTLRFGPLEELPKISIKANVASVHVDGSPTYGIKFMSFESGTPEQLKKYLDFFFKK